MARCPSNRPANAFIFNLFQTLTVIFGSLQHHVVITQLQKVVPGLMKKAGYDGYFTNHSLRASVTIHLFDSGVDEQLIMSCTGHSSKEGVRAYKRTTTKLKELTSDILNGVDVKDTTKIELTSTDEEKSSTKTNVTISKEQHNQPMANVDYKENCVQPVQSVLQITGGTNITINFRSVPKLQ